MRRETQQTVHWGLCLAGLPFAPLLRQALDVWHGQTWWLHWWAVWFFGLFLASGRPAKANRPLAVWVLYLLGTTLLRWTRIVIEQKVYPDGMLLGVMHLLVLVSLYLSATATWNALIVRRLLRWLSWSSVVSLVYGLCQWGHYDPFFKSLDVNDHHAIIHGMTGNPDHFGAYLSFALPVLWARSGWGWMLAALVSLVVIVRTQSMAALLAGGLVSVFALWRTHRRLCQGVLLSLGVVGAWMVFAHNGLNASGRFEAWALWWPYVRSHPWAGSGLGFISILSRTITDVHAPLYGWRHAHNEYYQLLIEQGLVGCLVVGWMVVDMLRHLRHVPADVRRPLGGIFLAFALNSLLNFPAHLWVLGSWAVFAYCAVYACAETS